MDQDGFKVYEGRAYKGFSDALELQGKGIVEIYCKICMILVGCIEVGNMRWGTDFCFAFCFVCGSRMIIKCWTSPFLGLLDIFLITASLNIDFFLIFNGFTFGAFVILLNISSKTSQSCMTPIFYALACLKIPFSPIYLIARLYMCDPRLKKCEAKGLLLNSIVFIFLISLMWSLLPIWYYSFVDF